MKEIIVYYSIDHTHNLSAPRFETPTPLGSYFFENKKDKDYPYKFCPSFVSFIKNVFVLKSPYTYEFNIEGTKVTSELYDQAFFNNHINVRSIPSQLFSLKPYLIFFTEEDSLKMSLEHPWLENNSYTQKCITIAGEFDIGTYFRTLDFAFHIKKEFKNFNITEGDVFYYTRFHTEHKIKFQRFMSTPKINEYRRYLYHIKTNSRGHLSKSLDYFYSFFKKFNYKSHILKEIKENLI